MAVRFHDAVASYKLAMLAASAMPPSVALT